MNPNNPSMTCRTFDSELLDLAEGAPASPELTRHLESCPDCRRRLQTLQHHLDLFQRVPSPDAPDELWQRIQSRADRPRFIPLHPVRWTAAAAAAVLLVSISAYFLFHTAPAPVERPAPTHTVARTVQPPSLDDLLARHNAFLDAHVLNADLVQPVELSFAVPQGGAQ